jgi:pimeloyl-ACP methyl ester carboxylesterase
MTRSLRWPILLAALVFSAPLGCAFAADRPEGQTLDVNGVKIWYSVQGKGEPVVLIHGFLASTGINWGLPGITEMLARDYQVITLDVRGHGLSDKPTKEEAYGLELVEDVVRLLDHLKIKKAHIVGYSMGGMIAGKLMAKYPDRVLTGTLGGMGWLREGSLSQWGFAQIGRRNPNAQALAICARSLAKLALTEEEIKSIHVPVTVLLGERDNFIKKLYLRPLQEARKDWPVVEIPDANHLTCPFKPQFREEIAAWLKKNSK